MKVFRLDKQPPMKTVATVSKIIMNDNTTIKLSDECTWCLTPLSKLSDKKKLNHMKTCKYRQMQECMVCARDLSKLNEYNRKTHVSFCRIRNEKNEKKLAEEKLEFNLSKIFLFIE